MIFMVMMMMMIMACATVGPSGQPLSFEAKMYQILDRSQVTYNQTKDTIVDLRDKKLISEETYQNLKKYGDIYADTHNAASESMAQYVEGKASKDVANAKVLAITKALTSFIEAATPYFVKLE